MAMSKEQQKVEKLHQMIKDGDVRHVTSYLHSLGNEAQDTCRAELARDGTSLHLAARLGYTDICKEILKTGVSVNQKQVEGHVVSGKAAIHEAVKGGHFGTMEFLISRGANVNIQESDGQTALHVACQFDNTDIVKSLVRNGADVNALDTKKQSPLQTSILRGPDESTRYLLKNGADVHIVDSDGQSPLHYAAEWGNMEIVTMLVSMGAMVNQQDNEGRTSLHLATDDDIYDFLKENGGDEAIRDLCGKPPRETQLDMSKKEYQDINKALSRHTDIMKKRSPQVSQVLNPCTLLRVCHFQLKQRYHGPTSKHCWSFLEHAQNAQKPQCSKCKTRKQGGFPERINLIFFPKNKPKRPLFGKNAFQSIFPGRWREWKRNPGASSVQVRPSRRWNSRTRRATCSRSCCSDAARQTRMMTRKPSPTGWMILT